MSSLMTKIEGYTSHVCLQAIDAGVALKRGVLVVATEASCALYDIYSLAGFEKWTKALIADLNFLSLIPSIKGLFKPLLQTLEAQKDLYYATMFIGSAVKFIDQKTLTYQVPKLKDKSYDWSTISLAVGNVLNFLQFFKKYGVFEYERCSIIASRIGSIRVTKNHVFNDIPFVNALVNKPNEFFVASASFIDIFRWMKASCIPAGKTQEEREWNRRLEAWNFDKCCKLVADTGRVIALGCYPIFGRAPWLIGVNFVAANTQKIAFLVRNRDEREWRH